MGGIIKCHCTAASKYDIQLYNFSRNLILRNDERKIVLRKGAQFWQRKNKSKGRRDKPNSALCFGSNLGILMALTSLKMKGQR